MASHKVQKHLAGEQETHCDKTNKELTSSKMVIVFACLVSVRFLLTSKVHLNHVTGHLQRAQGSCFTWPKDISAQLSVDHSLSENNRQMIVLKKVFSSTGNLQYP